LKTIKQDPNVPALIKQFVGNLLAANKVCILYKYLDMNHWSTFNMEFAQMLYSGTLGLSFYQGKRQIDFEKVIRMYNFLSISNPHLRSFNTPEVRARMMAILSESANAPVKNTHWPDNYLLPNDDVEPAAGVHSIDTLTLGIDLNQEEVKYDKPALLAIIFPYLFTNGCGYYSLCQRIPNLNESLGGWPIVLMLIHTESHKKKIYQ
jgi:hypothetical protein